MPMFSLDNLPPDPIGALAEIGCCHQHEMSIPFLTQYGILAKDGSNFQETFVSPG